MKRKESYIRVAIYARLSKEDYKRGEDNSSESIKNQKALLEEYASTNEWIVVGEYIDDDWSGSDRDRPGFKQMLEDAEKKKFDIILVKSQARFCRDVELIEKYLHGKFPEWGIRFMSLIDRADTEDKANKKSRQITGLKDEWYLEDLSDDICRVLGQKQRDGVYIASFPLYGYLKDPNQKGHIIPDPEAASIVKEIYKLYLSGYGMQTIARMLNDRGVENPYLYKINRGISINNRNITPKGRYWEVATISSILDNQIYIGDLVQGRYKKLNYKSKKLIRVPRDEWKVKKGTHEAIISYEDFEQVQAIRKSKSRIKDGKRHIFVGKVYCGECDQVLSAGRYPKKKKMDGDSDKEYVQYLRCSSRLVDKKLCAGSTILFPTLEEHLINQINEIAETYFDAEDIEKKVVFEDENKKNLHLYQTEERRLGRQLEDSKLALSSLYMDKMKGIITESEFVILKINLTDTTKRLAEEQDRLHALIEKCEKKLRLKDDRRAIVLKYRHLDSLSREVINELIDKIYIWKKDENGSRQIKIIWNL